MRSKRNLYNNIVNTIANVECKCGEDIENFPADCTYLARLTQADIRFIDEVMYDLGVDCGFEDLPKVNPKRIYALWIVANRRYGRQPDLHWELQRITD